ncbi:MAG: sulfotransferase family protein [Caulobacteraceae bacterium]
MLIEERLGLGERPRHLNQRMIFTPDRSALYVSVPKTGCTTIKMVVGASVGLLAPAVLDRKTRGGIHGRWRNREIGWSDLVNAKREALLTGPGTYRFTSVRNPFERVVSCYLNKIIGKGGKYYLSKQLKEEGDISMLSFLKFVRKQPPLERDVRGRAMTDLCFTGRVEYDDIVRYETFEPDLRRVMAVLKVPHFGIPSPSDESKTDAGKQVQTLLGEEERDLVREIYKLDFQAFGYSEDLP